MTGSVFDFLTAGRIVFGRGKADVVASAVRAMGQRVLLVRGRSVSWVDTLAATLGAQTTTVICQGEPTIDMVDDAVRVARAAGCDVVLAVGGGSVIDLGKAVAALVPGATNIMDHLESVGRAQPLGADPLPFVAVPTTSGTGAEVTKNAVIAVPAAGRKVSLRDNRMLPNLAVIDPALTDNAPRGQTLASGLDALTQVVEPYLSGRANPLTDALCRAAIPQGARALSQLAQAETQGARDDMAFVSLMGGLALANAGLGAVHGLAGVMGGRLGAPHGLICGRLLGPVLAANATALPDNTRFEEVAQWLGAGFDMDPSSVFETLPHHLDKWGVARLGQWVTPQVDLMQIAQEAASASSMQANPCVLPANVLVKVMQQAI
ncbi:iron-containing alcohol dehydrogenase [Roseobacter sp.]|uniref:iron-containing alcohol dehydrogenase n=1 Tax=Roseobacter sp. TaxID=1907202 RepID=UPI0032981F19